MNPGKQICGWCQLAVTTFAAYTFIVAKHSGCAIHTPPPAAFSSLSQREPKPMKLITFQFPMTSPSFLNSRSYTLPESA